MKKLTFLIPLGIGSKWENNELRYMLRSLDKHISDPFDVVIYSQKEIDWLQDVVVKIVPREYPKASRNHFSGIKHYENYFDTVNKLKRASKDEDVPEDFIYIYDDILLLRDIKAEELDVLYAANDYNDNPKYWDNPRSNKWLTTINRALVNCKRNSFPTFIYETHLPRKFNKERLTNMFKTFPVELIPYAPCTLYYNMYFKKPNINYKNHNVVKAGFYGKKQACDGFMSKSKEEINNAIKGKIWANYNDSGMTGTLKLWIEDTYPDKSRFEK